MESGKNINSLEDWDLFVLRHQNLTNVKIHFVSFLMFWLSPVLAILFSPYFIIGFFLSGLIGTLGHYVTKDGTVDAREATSSTQVVKFSSAMAFLFLQGKYEQEILRAKVKFEKFKNGEIISNARPEMFNKLGAHL